MRIDKDSYGTIAGAWIFCIILICLCAWLAGDAFTWCFSVVAVLFMIFVTWFHRVPVRQRTGNDRVITSVADGKVVILEKTFEKEFLNRECIQVSIYMNFFDVHSNFWPMDGEITYYKYHPGKYFLAFKPKASDDNEHSSTAIRNPHGEILFKQIAGFIARRIVCYSSVGADVRSGEQCGIIKFGSRIDMFLPLDADIKVKKGQLTRACETVIAELR
jgi:phosphatidylserine decarboxylase